MNLRTALEFLTSRPTRVLVRINPAIQRNYRVSFLAAAEAAGLLTSLQQGLTVQSACAALGDHADPDVVRAWLQFGESIGQVRHEGETYHLRGGLAESMAAEPRRVASAALAEAAIYHHQAIVCAPGIATGGRRLALNDQDGQVIARSTRVLEPLLREVVRHITTPGRSQHLLEVGAGSGEYVRYAAKLNPRLTALCIDMQPDVVRSLQENVATWGLQDRVAVRCCDLRELREQPRFDVVTLHNNLYYAPAPERLRLIEECLRALAPGGRLVITSTIQSTSPTVSALNLWFLCSDFGGALPTEDEMVALCREAGFAAVDVRRPVPGFPFVAVIASTRPKEKP